VVAVNALAASYSTDFNGDEAPISEGGKWSNRGLDWTPVHKGNGIAYGTHAASGYDDSYAYLSGFGPDHSVEATIYKTGTTTKNQEVELHLRWADSAHSARGYEVLWEARNRYGYIVRWNGALGDFKILAPVPFPRAPVTGDVLKAQIVGNVISVFLNGTLVKKITDSTWTSGNPGMGFFSEDATGDQNVLFAFTKYVATDQLNTRVPHPPSGFSIE
jgi:hypothetical protein